MKFQERFALELKGSKFSQTEIAEKLGIDKGNISKWKKGENIPSLEVFYELCRLLEVSADFLLGLVD